MAAVVSKNSTIVRSKKRAASAAPLAIRAARAGFRVIGPLAPSLASSAAERLFLSARRHPRPAWEQEALSSAEALQIPHEGTFLPAWRWGDGKKTVLLVHGWEGRGSQLTAFVEPLVARGFSVVAFDAPGHGDGPPGLASVVEHARAVASVGEHLGRVHAIVAHSVGGAASLFAMRLGLRADRLALVAPPKSPERFAAGFGAMLGLSPEVQSGVVARLERRYSLRMEDLDVRADAARFAAPILVVHDVDDRVVPFEDGLSIANAASAGRFAPTRGLGHQRILRAPEVIDAVVPFILEGGAPATFAETLDGDLYFRDRRW